MKTNDSVEIVNLLLRGAGFSERYLTQNIPLRPGEFCLSESEIGLQIAKVVGFPQIVKKRFLDQNKKLPKVIRKASDEDLQKIGSLEEVEKEAHNFCLERVLARNLSMKLIKVTFAFDRSKALFMFTADGRVDFRELVRDLAHKFKTRIEMKQIGVRDEARLLGGIGNCGFPLCCLTFLKAFNPVSIKMAKDQGLSLIPSKISGLCGRLMCCLQYEHETYACLLKILPRIGKRVATPKGEGRVKQFNILKSLVYVELNDGETHEFTAADVKQIRSSDDTPDEESDFEQDEYQEDLD